LGTTGPESDNDVTRLFKSAELHLEDGNYERASLCLQEAHLALRDTILLKLKEWERVVNLLLTCHCELKKFNEAEELISSSATQIGPLQSYGAKDRAKTVCELGNIFIGKMILNNCLDAGERVAIKVIEIGEGNGVVVWETERSLAEIYRRQKKFQEAVELCQKSTSRLKGIDESGWDEGESESQEGKLLLALIYFTAGDMESYVVREGYLSKTYKGEPITCFH